MMFNKHWLKLPDYTSKTPRQLDQKYPAFYFKTKLNDLSKRLHIEGGPSLKVQDNTVQESIFRPNMVIKPWPGEEDPRIDWRKGTVERWQEGELTVIHPTREKPYFNVLVKRGMVNEREVSRLANWLFDDNDPGKKKVLEYFA